MRYTVIPLYRIIWNETRLLSLQLPIAVFGDLGVKNPVSLNSLKGDAAEGRYHLAIHAGDIGVSGNPRQRTLCLTVDL